MRRRQPLILGLWTTTRLTRPCPDPARSPASWGLPGLSSGLSHRRFYGPVHAGLSGSYVAGIVELETPANRNTVNPPLAPTPADARVRTVDAFGKVHVSPAPAPKNRGLPPPMWLRP
jgi:hypothetical protein